MVVRLKYPGKTNKENTHGHAWSVYVNPVGHDAAVKPLNARCSAAGYRCVRLVWGLGLVFTSLSEKTKRFELIFVNGN